MVEVWKDIGGYNGDYQISNKGNVRSFKNKKVRVLKPAIDANGYYILSLCLNSTKKTLKIHKLVAKEFLNHVPCGHKIVVDHIDENKLNNNLDNLQLISNRDNVSKSKKGGSSDYIGVCWDGTYGKWLAQIHVGDNNKFIGYFKHELDAAKAYQDKLKEITGGQ